VKVRERPTGSGVWWVFIDHQGKRKAKKIGKDKRLANEVAKKIEAKLVLGQFDLATNGQNEAIPEFREYSQIWLTGYVQVLRRQSTFERYQDILTRYVNPALSDKPIDEIKRGDIRDLILSLHRRGLSRTTSGGLSRRSWERPGFVTCGYTIAGTLTRACFSPQVLPPSTGRSS